MHKDLASFQNFIYRHLKCHPDYEKVRPSSNQPVKYFAIAKKHNFDNFKDIKIENLKRRPIIDQTGRANYHTSKVVANYFRPLTINKFVIKECFLFPDILKSTVLENDEEIVSYDVESLFTNIPIKETIDYICNEIYRNNAIEPMCKESIFRKLLYKLSSECVFSVNNQLIKQIDGCPMERPISVVYSDIFMNKMERDFVIPIAPNLYKCYVDDTFAKRKKNKSDDLYNARNNYHPNINLTVEVNPKRFLDTEIISNGNRFETKVFHKDTKLATHWSAAVPKRYKRNSILADLHRAKAISSYFVGEVEYIRKKYKKAGYPHRFIELVINDFMKIKDDNFVPDRLFDVREKVFLRLTYCQQNEEDVKKFINHLTIITKEKFQFIVLWTASAVQSLFPIKDKVCHISCVIYQGICSCGATYLH